MFYLMTYISCSFIALRVYLAPDITASFDMYAKDSNLYNKMGEILFQPD